MTDRRPFERNGALPGRFEVHPDWTDGRYRVVAIYCCGYRFIVARDCNATDANDVAVACARFCDVAVIPIEEVVVS